MVKDKKHPDKIGLEWCNDYRGYLPNQEGVYLVIGVWDSKDPQEIDVYMHPKKGLSCFQEDFGSGGTGIDDETDCHVSIQRTGLEFIEFVRPFDQKSKLEVKNGEKRYPDNRSIHQNCLCRHRD